MKYITYKRFKGGSMSGYVNIPAFSECEGKNGIIYYKEKPICFLNSENAHIFFVYNEDEQGRERGRLIFEIKNKLAKKDSQYQKRWDKIWEDKLCHKYKRKDYEDYWLWGNNFYNADIKVLDYIFALIK